MSMIEDEEEVEFAKRYRILYDFEAEMEGELTVHLGEIVEGFLDHELPSHESMEGWTLVKALHSHQHYNAIIQMGIVPDDYMIELTKDDPGYFDDDFESTVVDEINSIYSDDYTELDSEHHNILAENLNKKEFKDEELKTYNEEQKRQSIILFNSLEKVEHIRQEKQKPQIQNQLMKHDEEIEKENLIEAVRQQKEFEASTFQSKLNISNEKKKKEEKEERIRYEELIKNELQEEQNKRINLENENSKRIQNEKLIKQKEEERLTELFRAEIKKQKEIKEEELKLQQAQQNLLRERKEEEQRKEKELLKEMEDEAQRILEEEQEREVKRKINIEESKRQLLIKQEKISQVMKSVGQASPTIFNLEEKNKSDKTTSNVNLASKLFATPLSTKFNVNELLVSSNSTPQSPNSNSIKSPFPTASPSSSSKNLISSSMAKSKFLSAGRSVQKLNQISKVFSGSVILPPRTPGLITAIDNNLGVNEVILRSNEFLSKSEVCQTDIHDKLLDIFDSLNTKLKESSYSQDNLVQKLSDFDDVIDKERRKYKALIESEKNNDILNRSNVVLSSSR